LRRHLIEFAIRSVSFWLIAVWQRQTVRRMVNRLEPPTPIEVPGILFLQIDGRAEPVVRQAMADGHAPTLARWIRDGSHRSTRCECDLLSQTGAGQDGILHGNNRDMPAFRWYDNEPIVGAATVHHLFKGWMTSIDDGSAPPPWTVPETSANAPVPAIAIDR
jgi:hypothetical protein